VEGPVEDLEPPGDVRCSRAVLDFLSSTDVGRRVPALEEDAVSRWMSLQTQIVVEILLPPLSSTHS